MHHRTRAALCGLLAMLIAGAVLAPTASALDPVDTAKLRKALTVNGILRHERVLQSIANANGGIRASGTAGFDASADYVKRQLVQAGYKITEQPFQFPFFQQTADPVFERVSPSPRVFNPDEFATMSYSGSGDVTGRSDYGPFIAVGIPAGGLFSGAEGKKTAEQAAIYGGTAGAPYDACYHQACDTINNLSTKALAELGDGVVHATWTLAKSKSGLFEDQSLRARKAKAKALKGKQLAGDMALR